MGGFAGIMLNYESFLRSFSAYLMCVVFLVTNINCASRVNDIKNKEDLAYNLIRHHYNNDHNQKRNKIHIYHKTTDKKSPYFMNKKFGLSNFLKLDKLSFSSKKCYIDSVLSKNEQQKLDSAYVNFKEVELNSKKINLKKIELIYPDADLDEQKVVSHITFPALIKVKDFYYAIIIDSDKFEGMFFFYKYNDGKWELICQRTLYVT